MVAGRLDPPAVLADRRRRSATAAAADPAMLAAVAGTLRRHPRREVHGEGVDAHRAVPGRRCRGPAAALALAERAADDLKAAGKVVGELAFTPTDAAEITVDAEIAPPARLTACRRTSVPMHCGWTPGDPGSRRLLHRGPASAAATVGARRRRERGRAGAGVSRSSQRSKASKA